MRSGFKCGTTKADCYQGLVDAGLVVPSNPSTSPLGLSGSSPLVWLGGSMPLDDDGTPRPAAAAAIQAWIAAGAKND